MNCFDCTQIAQRERAAVGVWADCGAALCTDHIIVRERQIRKVGTYTPVLVTPSARILRCTTCDTAYTKSVS